MSLPDTIGGHSREVLTEALRQLVALEKLEKYHLRGWPDDKPFPYPEQSVKLAARDASDPAKLAELMASALQPAAPVLVIEDNVVPSREPRFDEFVIRWDREHGGTIQVYPPRPKGDDYAPLWVMEQARALLLHILELPESATAEDAVKALEVGK